MSTGLITMAKEKTPTKGNRAFCKLCGKIIISKDRLLLNVNGTTYIGYVHEKCMRRAYDILLINKI
jgi:hypothetical protein